LAGYFGVPVAFLSGDQNAVRCAKEELEDPVGVVVKKAVGRSSARLLPFPKVETKIKEGVAEAITKMDKFEPTTEEGQITLDIDFKLTSMAEMALLMPGTEKKSGRTVSYNSKDFKEIFRAFRAMLSLASSI
jgi:D-amino peptidase